MKEAKGGFRLKWPWNVLLGVVVAVGLGFVIGFLWSVLLVLLVAKLQKGKHPGMPEEGYCLARTRKQLGHALLGLMFAVLGGGILAAGGLSLWKPEKFPMDMERWEMAALVLVGVGVLALGLFVLYIDLRDSLVPGKSTLAQSIRAQLPYPEEAPPVAQLFAMVDQDIKEHGQWFDRVAVGQEWVLGDQVSKISRIRVVFGRDEVRTKARGERMQTTRITQIHILDDRRQVQITDLRDPRELPVLMECLRLRVPEAKFLPYGQYDQYARLSEEEWQALEREFQSRKTRREQREAGEPTQVGQNVILTREDGSVTSRIEPELLAQLLSGDESFTLTAGQLVENRFGDLWCIPTGGDWFDLVVKEGTNQALPHTASGFRWSAGRREVEAILDGWMQGKAPNVNRWEPVNLRDMRQDSQKKREVRPARLELRSGQGIHQSHTTFTSEDVRVAAEGLVSGRYSMVQVTLEGGYLLMRVETGDKADGRCTVSVTHPDGKELRFYEQKCTHRQAANYLREFYGRTFRPNWKEWKDCTKQVQKA